MVIFAQSLTLLKTTELYTFKGPILYDMNYIPIKKKRVLSIMKISPFFLLTRRPLDTIQESGVQKEENQQRYLSLLP